MKKEIAIPVLFFGGIIATLGMSLINFIPFMFTFNTIVFIIAFDLIVAYQINRLRRLVRDTYQISAPIFLCMVSLPSVIISGISLAIVLHHVSSDLLDIVQSILWLIVSIAMFVTVAAITFIEYLIKRIKTC